VRVGGSALMRCKHGLSVFTLLSAKLGQSRKLQGGVSLSKQLMSKPASSAPEPRRSRLARRFGGRVAHRTGELAHTFDGDELQAV
jgi:hypothetical protein